VPLTPQNNINAFLPTPIRLAAGGPIFKVVNKSTSKTITIKDDSGATVAVVPTASGSVFGAREIWLEQTSTNKVWLGFGV